MAHKTDFTMFDLSVLGPSTALDTWKSTSTVNKTATTEGLLEFSKLRGKQRIVAMEHLQEIIESLPKIADEQARAQKILQDGLESVQRIIDILGDDADKLPMDALGDFHVLATNPEPFAAALEKAAKNFEQRSPDRRNNVMPGYHSKKLKTSASLNRTTSRSKASATSSKSGQTSASTMRSNRTLKTRPAATPLGKQSSLSVGPKKKTK